MIWEFIKDSPAWRIAGWLSIIYAAGWLVLTQGDPKGVAAGAPLLVFLCSMAAINLAPDTAFRCTFFDAALPIAGPPLWIAKMIVLLGSLWLPVLAASAAGLLVVGNPAMPLLDAAGGITVMYLFGQSFRIRQFHEPRWICAIILTVGGAAISVIDFVYRDSGLRVLAGYLLIAAALFLVNLARVPKCFQCAPPDAVKAKPARSGAAIPTTAGMVWWRAWRSLFGWQVGMAVLVVWFTSGNSLLAMLAFAPPVAIFSWANWSYLAHLPFSMRKLFCFTWGPMAAAILVGNQASAFLPAFHRVPAVMREPRIVFTTLAVSLALFLCWIFALQVWGWRRLSGVPLVLRGFLVATFPLFVAVAWILIPSNDAWRQYGPDPIPYYALQLAEVLPESPLLLAPMLLIPLLLLYLLAERTFCEMEYPLSAKSGVQPYLQRS